MSVRTWLFAGVALAATAGTAWAQSSPSQPGERLGASGAPVLQNAAPNSASAQQSALSGTNVTTNPRAANAPTETLLGEVIVTAEKREQSLQQVPVAVSAFTAEKRDLLGINSVVDQTNYTPGLTYTQGNDRLSLRGVGRLTNAHTADSGTAIYVDGVFTTSTTQAGRSPLFIERTEVLRGPQGTLYGRNAIGGAYNVISKRPSKEFSGEGRLTFGNYGRERFDGALSVPVTDWLRLKFGYTKLYQDGGFLTNTIPGAPVEVGPRDETYYEFQAAGEIGKFDFWFYYGQNVWDNSAPPGNATGGSFAPPDPTPGNGVYPTATFCFTGALNCKYLGAAGNPVLTTGNLRNFTRDTYFNNRLHEAPATSTQLTYHFPSVDLKYIGGWQKYDYRYTADTDGTGVQSYQVPLSAAGAAAGRTPTTVYFGTQNTYEEDEEFYSHELNLATTWDKPVQFLGGLYYYHEKFQYPQHVYAANQPQISNPVLLSSVLVGGRALAAPDPTREYVYTNNFATVSSKAVFGQVDWTVIEHFKLTAGLRYTNDEKKTTEAARFIAFGTNGSPALSTGEGLNAAGLPTIYAVDITSATLGVPTAAQLAAQGGVQQGIVKAAMIDPVTGIATRGLRDGSNAVTGTAGLEWTPDRRTLAYLKYSRGYKAFGFNTTVATVFSPFPYSKPEQMDALEAGLKKDWTRRFQTNITGFYDLYYDAQVPISIQQGTTPAFSIFYNVPRSILQGVELESVYQPIDRLNILFTYAYLDSHVSKACCLSDPVDPTATAAGANPAGASSQGAVDAITGLPTRGQNLAGQALPFTPQHKIALNVTYDFDLGRWGSLIPSFSFLHRSEQYTSFFNRSYNLVPAIDQVDLRFTYREPKNRFTVIAYARNLFDAGDYQTITGTRNSIGQVYTSYTLVDPRTYGVELHARF